MYDVTAIVKIDLRIFVTYFYLPITGKPLRLRIDFVRNRVSALLALSISTASERASTQAEKITFKCLFARELHNVRFKYPDRLCHKRCSNQLDHVADIISTRKIGVNIRSC